jgi:tryptophanyl-tRNA synthetase
METVVSGIRPTGNLHLGNYFGAVRGFLQMQQSYNCFFFIADWHSLTTHPRPENIVRNAHTILAEYLACGLDPERAAIYFQSDVPEVLELYLYLNMNAYLGELERTTTFKEKARKQPQNVNAGLLTYPTLMAGDILLHRAHKVPVGKDQEQNMEMARKFARRFNTIYETDLFPEPASWSFTDTPIKIPGLDGSGKMGKSEGNAIYLSDDAKTITKKVLKAVTDSGPTEPDSPVSEPVANLFAIMEVVSKPETLAFFREQYATCAIRYGDLKKQLAADIVEFAAPIRERILEIEADKDFLQRVAAQGAEKARYSAQQTMKKVREIIGFAPSYYANK